MMSDDSSDSAGAHLGVRTDDACVIRTLSSAEASARVGELSDVLIDCVNGGASVSFMAPLGRDRADAFWHFVVAGIASGERTLLVAEEADSGEMLGTVQLILRQPENQPHRAEVAKMLVRRSARRRGLGARLMRAVEDAALAAGKTLLVLDTVTGADGERLYARLGWQKVGVIPDYALMPDGAPCATTVFYKRLAAVPRAASSS